jgi:glycerol-3-phosphate acyltransferase PlsY
MRLAWAITSGYLLGSLSFSIIVIQLLKGVDIRRYGSGNAGMTNVLRNFGKGPAAIVFAGDFLKGWAGVYLGICLGGIPYGVAAGLAAMAGHTYPIYFGFKGGKGVATGFAVLMALAPDVALIAFIVFIITIFISRFISLGSLLAAVSVIILVFIFDKPLPVVILGLIVALFVIYRHKSNMIRLYKGTENKISKTAKG